MAHRISKIIDGAIDSAAACWPGDHAAIVTGDTLTFMRSLPSGCVDLIFADPPYFLSNGGSSVQSGKRVAVDKGEWDEGADPMQRYDFHRRWLHGCRRTMRQSATIFVSSTHHSLFAIGLAMQSLGFHILNLISWYKPNASPNLGCRQLTHSTEHIIWAAPRKLAPLAHYFAYDDMREVNDGKQLRDFWEPTQEERPDYWKISTTPAREKTEGRHSAQKPEALLDRCIMLASRPGELVLDPFCGSGTTGVMAVNLGRKFIGIDNDPASAGLAARRIIKALAAKPHGGSHGTTRLHPTP